MNARRSLSKLQRGLYLSVAAAFVFFLTASAPHRVHHFFEQFPAPAEQRMAHAHEHADGAQHSHHDHHTPKPKQQNDCVVLSVAQNAHASLVQAFDFTVVASAVARCGESTIITASSFNPSPFSQRAPPQA